MNEVEFLGFALGDCTVDIDPLRRSTCESCTVPRSSWRPQSIRCGIRRLLVAVSSNHSITPSPRVLLTDEAPLVEFAIEAYLAAQIREFKF
jgi:hypothetical protein